MLKNYATLIVSLLLVSNTVFSKPVILDSLKAVYSKSLENDSANISTLEELVKHYIKIDVDSALYYSDVLRTKLNNSNQADCKYYQLLGRIYKEQHNLVLFEQQYSQALSCFEQLNDKEEIAQSKMELGIALAYQGKIKEAKTYFKDSRKMFLELNNELESVNCAMHLGTINIMSEEKGEGLDSYFVAYKYFLKVRNYKQLAKVCNNIGLVYSSYVTASLKGGTTKLESADKTEKYLSKALEFFQKGIDNVELVDARSGAKDLFIKSQLLANIASVYLKKQEYDISLGYLHRGLKIAQEINSDYSTAIFYHDIAYCKSRLGHQYEALDAINNSVPLLQKMNAIDQLVRTYDLKSHILIQLSRYQEAHESCKHCYEMSKRSGTLDIQKIALDCITKTSNSLKIYKDAYLYQKKYIQVNDSIQLLNSKEKLLSIEKQNQYEKEKALLEQENAMSEILLKKEKFTSKLFAGMSILSLLGLGLLGFFFKLAKKQTKRIEEKNLRIEEKKIEIEAANAELSKLNKDLGSANQKLNNFTSVAAHDLKSPLRTISTYSQLLQMRNKDLSEKDNQMLTFVSTSSKQLSSMIDDLLTFSKLDEDLGPAEHVEMSDVITTVKNNLASVIDEADVKIVAPANLYKVKAHSSLITQLFQNLMANGIKFRKKDQLSVIKITAEESEDVITYSISDNGIGIEPKYFDKIFTIFKRLNSADKYEGSGIGLATCKTILDHYGQKIWLESEVGMGTRFYFTLPKA